MSGWNPFFKRDSQ